ncbi:MAG TPA: Mur ligase domain-containing protein [Cyclobacteriaceae bacterium]
MEQKKKFHFIGIGGSLMHKIAIALKELGHTITGSDDEIVDPSRSKLLNSNLLPTSTGWHPERIDKSLDVVIFGRHTLKDNPELLKAQQLGLKVYTCPEYIYEYSFDKQRIVVVGSHGRNMVASMMIHVLRYHNRQVDHVISTSSGKEFTVKLSKAPVIIIDGSESPSTTLYHTPQFIKYKQHIGILTEIAWNPETSNLNENDFIRQYDLFADTTPKGGMLIYKESDKLASVICNKERPDVLYIPYKAHASAAEGGKDFLVGSDSKHVPVQLSGKQNFQYFSAAYEALKKIGITPEQFYKAIPSFKGIVE